MDVNNIQTVINSLGFPIFCALAMFYMWYKELKQHAEESTQLREAINNNTLIMERICAKLDIHGAEVPENKEGEA